MDAATQEILKPYLFSNGKYDTDALYTNRRMPKPETEPRFKLGDRVLVERTERQNGAWVKVQHEAIIKKIWSTAYNWDKPGSYGYTTTIGQAAENAMTLSSNTDPIPTDLILVDDTHFDSPITYEVFRAAVLHNEAMDNSAKVESHNTANEILAKSDDEITDDEWQILIQMGRAESYEPSSPDDYAAPLHYRRIKQRDMVHPLFATDEPEEELAQRGL